MEYTRGPDMGGGVGGLLYSSRSTINSQPSTLRYNLSNGRGDIVAQSDAYAALTWTASYEAYGKRTQETGENKDKQRGNSKDEAPTGLLNEGFRYRDIETGVWLSRDPAGFVDGPNLYAYVKQNPWTAWDPDGLAEKKKQEEKREEKFDPKAKLYKVTGDPKTGVAKLTPISAKDIPKKNAEIWVNGMANDPMPAAELGLFHTGKSEFYMIHNPSNGGLSDLGECSVQKVGFRTQVADTTRDILKNFDLKTANITSHSQGTMILNNALRDLRSEGVDMKGVTLNYHGAAANVWRTRSLAKSIGGDINEFKGHALDPVHNIVGGNTLNPARIVGSLLASPLVMNSDRDKSPHSKAEGQAAKINPMFHTNPLFGPLVPTHN